MFEILTYPFFTNAIIGGLLIALISSILGVFIIMRKEANITHSIANFLFFGVAVSLIFNGNYYLYAILFGIFGSLLLFFIEKTNFITKESSKEIVSQAGIAGGIFIIGFLPSLNLDINNFLFGNILFINKFDISILIIISIILLILLIKFGKNFISITINEDIAKSKGINTNIYNLVFLIFLSIFIGISIKIFGIMLIGAFLIIPTNSSKLFSKNLRGVFINSYIISSLGVILGLFISYYLGTNSGATIVIILLIVFITSLVYKNYK